MRKRMIRMGWLALLLLLLYAGADETYRKALAQLLRPYEAAQVLRQGLDAAEEAALAAVQPAETMEYEGEAADAAPVVSAILERGSREFFCGYPVEEAFLCWIGGAFGQELLWDIEEQLTEDTDSGMWYEWTGNTMHALWARYCADTGSCLWQTENVMFREAADSSCVKLDFLGDICLDDGWHTMQASGGTLSGISCDIKEELEKADLVMLNNEFTFTDRGEALENKAYTFRSRPENVRLLQELGTDIVSLANNHAYDFGEQGLVDTMDTLRSAKIAYSSAGYDIAEASSAHYLVVGGRKIGIVSVTEIERFSHHTKKAGEQMPGVLKSQQKSYVQRAVAEARRYSDYVIVFAHWGAEGSNCYDSGQEELAKTYVEMGADAVIGGHPHRLQGVAFLENVPVAYSLGNFWFSTGTLYTTIAQIRIDEKGELSLYMLPCVQRGLKTSLLEKEADRKDFYHYLADVSSDVGIDEDGRVHPYRDVSEPGQSPYAYTSGRRYGIHPHDEDLDGRAIDMIGNLE